MTVSKTVSKPVTVVITVRMAVPVFRLDAVSVTPTVPVLAYAGKAGPSLMMMVTVCTVVWPYTAPPCPY